MPRVAYVKEDIDCGGFIIKKGAIFRIDRKDKNILRGFWKGGTSRLEKLNMSVIWMFDEKLSCYKVLEKCLCCKYADYVDGGCGCNREMCYYDE